MKDADFGCFYLAENLDEPEDSKRIAKKVDWDDYLYELPPPPPDSLSHHPGKQRCYYVAFAYS